MLIFVSVPSILVHLGLGQMHQSTTEHCQYVEIYMIQNGGISVTNDSLHGTCGHAAWNCIEWYALNCVVMFHPFVWSPWDLPHVSAPRETIN